MKQPVLLLSGEKISIPVTGLEKRGNWAFAAAAKIIQKEFAPKGFVASSYAASLKVQTISSMQRPEDRLSVYFGVISFLSSPKAPTPLALPD
jgi:hypothetical protein